MQGTMALGCNTWPQSLKLLAGWQVAGDSSAPNRELRVWGVPVWARLEIPSPKGSGPSSGRPSAPKTRLWKYFHLQDHPLQTPAIWNPRLRATHLRIGFLEIFRIEALGTVFGPHLD